ncbi:MAG: response regulator transcription factor [Anaerolineae bacterium]|nr:response regulator transcription factor [Phycisphaerae bacterium]
MTGTETAGSPISPRTADGKFKILLIDDHPIVRQGLVQLINQEVDMHVCAEASNAREAMEMAASTAPDVAVVDISLEDRSGVELIKEFGQRFPNMLCLALSMYDESMYAVRVLRAGGRGYVMKQEATKKVIAAIRRVVGGQVYVSDAMASRLVGQLVLGENDRGSPVAALSDRELEVLTLIGRGMGTREVAERLFISVKTVEAHKERLKEKLKLQGSTELVRFAVQFTLDQANQAAK